MDWVYTHVPAWSTCLWCLYTVVVVVRASCPDNALERAMGCTAGLGLGPPSSPANAFVEKGQIQRAKQACRDNSFKKAISCLEEITGNCQGNSDQEHFLRNMVDVQKARDFVTYFCSHLNEYEEYAPCIGRMHSTLIQCVHQQRKNMETKVKASSNMDYLMTSTCKYFYAAEVCSDRVLSESCGVSAADMVERVFKAFKPPICNSVPYTNQDAQRDDAASDPSSGAARSRPSAVEVTWLCFLFLVMVVGWVN